MLARLVSLSIFLLIPLALCAQKVGVVLSGGGAKGLAHIGVLKALEENNIPIDYIVGTSMGAVVAGFYAAGYSPAEMEKMALSPEFARWVRGTGADKQTFFYTKNDPDASAFTFKMNVDSGKITALQTLRINDSELNMALCRLLSPAAAAAGYEFDSLMVPFRALAADIFTQQEIVLDSGVLSDAIRASFTVPVFYRPIKIDNKYYFDGGVYNNFPVNVMRQEFNPDVIIGVNVSSNSHETYPYESDEKAADNPLVYLLTSKSNPALLTPKDIYLLLDADRFTALEFEKSAPLIALGYQKTLKDIQEIKSKIEARRSYQELYAMRTGFKNKYKPLIFSEVSVTGISKKRQWFTNQYLRDKRDSISLAEIEDMYVGFSNETTLDGLSPQMIYDSLSGQYKFETRVRYRQRLNLDAGLLVSNRNVDYLYFGATYRRLSNFVYEPHANFYLGRFYNSALFNTKIQLPLNFKHYIDPHIVYNTWNYSRAGDFTLGSQPLTYIIRNDLHTGINLGLAPGKKNKLMAGVDYFYNKDEYTNRDRIFTDEMADRTTMEGWKYTLSFEQNSLNRKQYADRGFRLCMKANVWSGTEKHYPGTTSSDSLDYRAGHVLKRLTVSSEKYIKYKNISLGYAVDAAYMPEFIMNTYRSTVLYMPAYYPLQDSRSIFMPRFRAYTFIAGGLKSIVSLRKNVDLRTELYVFQPFNNISESENSKAVAALPSLNEMRTAGCVTFVYHSGFGPLALSMNYYDDPANRVGIFAHFGYVIFNRSSLD